METIDVTIRKPLYGNFVNIRDRYVETAIKQGKMLKITIPKGTAIVDPKEWKKNGRRVEQVFNYADRPMVLYGGNVPVEPPPGYVKEDEGPKTKSLFE